MSSPLVTADDLAVLLNDSTIDRNRADYFIARAQTLCESTVSPLPAGAEVVVERVAARAYVSTVSSRSPQLGAAGSPFGGVGPQALPGVILLKSDVRDLRRLAGSSSAFEIDQLDAAYALPGGLPYWDAEVIVQGDAGTA